MLLFCFFWSLKLSLSQQIPVLSHVFAVDWKTPGQMQFTAIKSQEGSLRRLWRDHAHDSRRCRNLLWRWWSAYVCRSPPQESLQVCPSCFITHLIHSSCLLLTDEQRSIYLSIYVYCVFSREEVCQYSDAILVPDQRSSPWRRPGGDSCFSSGRQWGDRDWNQKVAECKLRVSTNPFPVLVRELTTPLCDLKYLSWPFFLSFLSFLYIYICRFQREFTQGVAPDWTITRIEHSKLLDWTS